MFLQARVQHLLSLPAGSDLSTLALGGKLWDGLKFDVPSFHSTVFWECTWLAFDDAQPLTHTTGKDAIQYNELQILKRLGFNMQVDLPYSHVVNYLRILDLVFEGDIAQRCWSILNDAWVAIFFAKLTHRSLLTPLYAQQPPHVLAVTSILLATRLERIALPEGWYLLFDVEWEDIWQSCGRIMELWRDWGVAPIPGAVDAAPETPEEHKAKENRWRRAWVLAESRKAVRKWVAERAPSTEGEAAT